MGSAVGPLVIGVIVNVMDELAPKLRPRMGGGAPGAGESQFAFPSAFFGWSRRDDAFVVRDKVSDDDREGVCAELVAEWKRLEAEWAVGHESSDARWAPGMPGPNVPRRRRRRSYDWNDAGTRAVAHVTGYGRQPPGRRMVQWRIARAGMQSPHRRVAI